LKIFKELVGFSKNLKRNQQFRGKLLDGPFDLKKKSLIKDPFA
jgi:hypothetical protein